MAVEHKKAVGSVWLPDDVFFSILSYLPAKPVARFRSVSHSWRDMLSSAPFVQLHLRRANRPGQLKVFFHTGLPVDNDLPDKHFYYTWQQDGGPAKKLMRHGFSGGFSRITKPLHGLVLLFLFHSYGRGFFVLNPCTNALLTLPDTKYPLKNNRHLGTNLSGKYRSPGYMYWSYGLGYCSATGEYKVVRLFSLPYDPEAAATFCEVFVLDAPAYWRPTAQQPPAPADHNVKVMVTDPPVFLNGLFYFLCRDGLDVITLDVGDETFGSPPPLPVANMALDRNNKCVVLGVDLNGSGTSATPPEILLNPEDAVATAAETHLSPETTTATCRFRSEYPPELSLFEESLVPLGRTLEEIVFSSPATRAWSEVLKLLPARTVSDLSLVCREWRAMVTTNRFIRSHAVHSNLIATHPRIKLVVDTPRDYLDASGFADLDDLIISGNRPRMCTSTSFICSPPCHGLNLGTFRRTNYLFNPCTGYQVELCPPDYDYDDRVFDGVMALGYDAATGAHLAVHLDCWNFETRAYELRCRTQLVGGHEVWKPAESPPRAADMEVPAAYANGKIYWVVDRKFGPQPSSTAAAACELLVFDMEARKFEVIQGPPCRLPRFNFGPIGPPGERDPKKYQKRVVRNKYRKRKIEPCHRHGESRITLLELHGALCVACSDPATDAIDMWMVKDDGAWSVEYRLEIGELSPEYSLETTSPMAIDPVDGRILLNTGTSLGYYDPKTRALETIYSVDIRHDNEGLRYRFCPVICQESLVCPLPGKY
ncbi:uncharacterized protein [Oryza sativa Japonica Group]|uniref:F-box domain-containing protein n=2 Tax=Oryza sativa subsp. japonica TaxID=39947 RepID=A3C5V1_ORYSJ|nr:hypothetical protein [Oryza sativa Japonica Group]AAP54333.1 F-box domain containing protein [Oryza sativa Japonica Group]EAZ16464.1 hypothetical protein OsJ_31933 [Oryza sativa Japonica Group]USI00711.1 F-box domain-containing protein [Oryza sativa Japonica Group]